MQQITLTVIMEKDDGHPVLLALQSFQEKSSSHRLTLPFAEAMRVGRTGSTRVQSPSIVN
jgi:hypothetical protein